MNILKSTLFLIFLVISVSIQAQSVGINTTAPDASAALDVTSTDKGLLITRVDTSAIAVPVAGLMTFQPSDNGFYFYNGSSWQKLGTLAPSIVDSDNDTKIQVEETADEDIIRFDVAGSERFKMVEERLEFSNPANSLYIGLDAGKNDDGNDNRNTYIGLQSGMTSSIAYDNTALGYHTLKSNVDGANNIAIGNLSLQANQSGTSNTVAGIEGMYKNISGINNTAIGAYVLHENTTASDNIAVGSFSLYENTIGAKNTALGYSTLEGNISGGRNTALGYKSMTHNTLGFVNTAVGNRALGYNTEGNGNSALGYYALSTNTKGEFNTGIGYEADVTSDSLNNATAIGYKAKVDSSNAMVLGGTGNNAINVGIGLTNPSATLDVVGTVQIVDGNQGTGKLLTSDTLGNASWQELTMMSDADNDTKIQVEETGDEDVIRFDVAGTEQFKMIGKRLEVVNSGRSVIIGEGAGINDDATIKENTFIGYEAASTNSTGAQNVAIGNLALEDNSTGSNNTAIGAQALDNNTIGFGNTAIGNDANVSSGNLTNATAIGFKSKVATSNSLVLGGTGTEAVKVGVGTNAPTELLSLAGVSGTDGILFPDNTLQTTAFTGSVPIGVITDTDNDTKIQVEETGDEDVIRFDTDGSQRMIINNVGFVGVGTSNPTANLTVIGTATTNTEIVHFSNSNNAKKAIVSLSNSGGGQLELLDGINNQDVLLSGSDHSYFNAANLGVGNNNPQEKLHVTGKIRMEDGNQALGKVMTSDANGVASWQIGASSITQTLIADADNDTKIQVEKTANDDVIRFDIGGTERWKMTDSRLESQNSGNSIFIGKDAGLVDDLTNNINVFIGLESGDANTVGSTNIGLGAYTLTNNIDGGSNTALGSSASASNTSGSSNVAVGKFSLFDNQTGSNNVAIGKSALEYGGIADANNVAVGFEAGFDADGSNNIFIGHQAGKNKPGNNKLYIDNSSTANPLIYGEFDNDLVEINGSLNVNTGNVGIGVSVPTEKLEVAGNALLIEDNPQLIFKEGTSISRQSAIQTNMNPSLTVPPLTATDQSMSFHVSDNSINGMTQVMTLLGDGNVGIGMASPTNKLEVLGTVAATSFIGDGSGLTNLAGDDLGSHNATQNIVLNGNWISDDGDNEGVKISNLGKVTIGATGSELHSIIKVSVSKNVGNISSDGMLNVDFSVPGVVPGSSVMISPSADLPNQVMIGQARVQSNGVVRVRFHNESNSGKDPSDMAYYITVIK